MSLFVSVFIVGLGFLSGLWVAVGLDPDAIMHSILAGAASSLVPGAGLFIWLAALLCLGFAAVVAYSRRGLFGLSTVGLAFVGGTLIFKDLGSCAARRRGSNPRFPTTPFSIHPKGGPDL